MGTACTTTGVLFFLLLLAPGCGGDAGPVEDLSDSPVRWLTDLEAGRAEAAKTGKPLFVLFRCVP